MILKFHLAFWAIRKEQQYTRFLYTVVLFIIRYVTVSIMIGDAVLILIPASFEGRIIYQLILQDRKLIFSVNTGLVLTGFYRM